jgi:excisionase family DNA binding protein
MPRSVSTGGYMELPVRDLPEVPPKEPGRLLDRISVNIKDAAKLIGTNDKQIRRALYARELPAVKLGKSYSIAVADLQAWFHNKKSTL